MTQVEVIQVRPPHQRTFFPDSHIPTSSEHLHLKSFPCSLWPGVLCYLWRSRGGREAIGSEARRSCRENGEAASAGTQPRNGVSHPSFTPGKPAMGMNYRFLPREQKTKKAPLFQCCSRKAIPSPHLSWVPTKPCAGSLLSQQTMEALPHHRNPKACTHVA